MKYLLIILTIISCNQVKPPHGRAYNFRQTFKFAPDTIKDSKNYILIPVSSFIRLDTTSGIAYKKHKYAPNEEFLTAYFVRKIDSIYGVMIQMPQCDMGMGWSCAVAHFSTKDTAVTFRFVQESDSTKIIDSVFDFIPRSIINP